MLLASMLFATASAADLDLEVALPGAEPVRVVLTDIEPGPLPGLLLEDSAGLPHRLTVQLAQHEGDAY